MLPPPRPAPEPHFVLRQVEMNPEGEFVAVFSSWEVLWHHVSSIADKHGYRVTKRRSSAYKDGKAGRFDLACDHGGNEYKSVATQRASHSRKTNCPWSARAVCLRSMGSQWKFVVVNGSHNHPPRDPNAPAGGAGPRNQPGARERDPPPVGAAPVATGRTAAGQLRADEDADAADFMASVEEAQERERRRVGTYTAEALERIERAMGRLEGLERAVAHMEQGGARVYRADETHARLDRVDAALARIEAFGGRLLAIEERMSVLEKEWE